MSPLYRILIASTFFTLLAQSGLSQTSPVCTDPDPAKCKAVDPYELCMQLDQVPFFDRSKLKRDDPLAVQYDACQALAKLQCVQAGQVVIKAYKVVLQAYVGNDKKGLPTLVGLTETTMSDRINLNIYDNFAALKKQNDSVFEEIVKAQNAFAPLLDGIHTLDDVQRVRDSMYTTSASIRKLLLKSSHNDSTFLALLDKSQEELQNIFFMGGGILSRGSCSVLKESFSKISQNSSEFEEKIYSLRRFVGKSTAKRALALEKFRKGMELEIYKRYGAAIGKDLKQIMAEFGAVFAMDSVLWDVTDWWANANANGLANRLHTNYLMYLKPLELLGKEMGRAEAFKKRIEGIAGLKQSIKDEAILSLNDKEKAIQAEIDFIKGRGWQGQLNRQKLLAKRRIALIPVTNKACHDVTTVFLNLANAATTFAAYEAVESKYVEHVNLCAKE